MREAGLVFVLCVLSLSVAQDCPLPTKAEIERELNVLLLNADGTQMYSPNVTEGSVQYVCLAQGSMIDTYQAAVLVATYTPNPGEAEQTMIFDIDCSSGTWGGRSGSLDPVPSNFVAGAPPNTNCYRCREGFDEGGPRCRACSSACNSGLMRCVGASTACCSAFSADGQCITDTNCTASSGPNYVATESNNFTCSCNLTCPDGFTYNSNCTDCDLVSICNASNPCMNGGQCIQNSPPDNYTCDCTGTGFEGVNCNVMLSSTPSPTPSSTPVPSSTPSPSPSPLCAIDSCASCQNSTCCKDCSSGSYLTNGCTCGPCTVSNCLRCQLLDSSCCTECGSGYELVNGCRCEAITYPCVLSEAGCERCDATGCCQTCSLGYSMSTNNCLCVCSLSCSRGYAPSANCTSCVLTNICEASNPCGTADCSLGSQPDQYTCYCAASTSNIQSQSLSASIIAVITVLSLIVAVCIALIVALVVVVVINIKKQKLQLQQPSHDYDVIHPTASDPTTQANQAYQVGRQLL